MKRYKYSWLLLGVLLGVFGFVQAQTGYCATFHAMEHLRVDGSAYFDEEVSVPALSIDWPNGNKQRISLNGTQTVIFSNPPPGAVNLLLKVSGGATTLDITWPSSVKWPGGEAPDLTESGIDIISFYYDGIDTYYGQALLDFQ